MADNSLINLGVAEFENLMETQGLENTVKGVLSIANDELNEEALGGVPLTIESLTDGSHPILDSLDRYRDVAPEERNIQPEEILTFFTNVSDFGKYDPEKGNFSGLKAGTYSAARAIPEAAGAGFGFNKGLAAGLYAQSFIPPAGIPGLIAKGIVVAVPTIAGTVAGAIAAGFAEDKILGKADPVVPSLQPATNLGETSILAASLIMQPWKAAPKGSTGALEFLSNFTNVSSGKFARIADEAFEVTAKNSGLSEKAFKVANDARLSAQRGPMFGGAMGVELGLARFNPAGFLVDPRKGPVGTRILGGIEKGIGKSMQVARDYPKTYFGVEGASVAGAGAGAYMSQDTNPYDEKSRFIYELAGSFIVPMPVQAFASAAPDVLSTVKRWYGNSKNTEGLLSGRVKNDSIDRIKTALQRSSQFIEQTDVDGKKLTNDEQFAKFFEELEKVSVGPDGKPVELTFSQLAKEADRAAGTRFSPTVTVIERELSNSSKDLEAATGRGREELQTGAVNMIRTLAATGDPAALTLSARLQQSLFEQNIIDKMDTSVTTLMKAGVKVLGREVVDPKTGSKIPSERGKLSEDLYKILTNQILQSKQRETQLWNEVRSYPLTEFYAKNGKRIKQPNVLQLLERPSRTGGLKFSAIGASKDLKSSLGAYSDDIDEMVEYFQEGVGRNPATAQKFFEIRSGLLEKASSLRRNGQIVPAGHLDQINDALLRDLTGQKNGVSEAYNNARGYTFARNNVFRRSFLNDMQVYDRQRGLILEPQQLLDSVFKGGNLATSRRIDQIKAAGRFLVDDAGFSEEVVGVMDTNEIMNAALRDSLSKVIDNKQIPNPANPNEMINSFVVNEAKLRTFREQAGTKELYALIPDLEGDLASVEAAQQAFDNTLGNIANRINPSKAKQLNFDEEQLTALYDTKAFQTVLQFEDPAKAVSKALDSERPTMALNSLYRMVDEANYKESDFTKVQAMSGLKSAIFNRALLEANKNNALPNGDVLQKELFGQLRGVDPSAKFSMSDFLIKKGLVDETVAEDGFTEMGRIQAAVKTIRGVEEAFSTGDFENILFKKPSLAKLFYVRIAGATAGGAVQNKLKKLLGLPQMGGGLIAEQTGSEIVQRFLLRGPESQRIKVMTELFSNPNMLAALMNENLTKSAKDKSMSYLEKIISPLARQVGRRVPLGIIAADKAITEEYSLPEQTVEEVVVPSVSGGADPMGLFKPKPSMPSNFPARPSPVVSPTTQASAVPSPPPKPVNSGPVDRTRYAALFPNDSISGMMNTQQLAQGGIASLMR